MKRLVIYMFSLIVLFITFLFLWSDRFDTQTMLTKNIREQEIVPIIKELQLKVIEDITSYHGEEAYFVLTAKDVKDRKHIIWLNQKTRKHRSELLSQAFLERDIRNRLIQKNMNETIIRIVPGIEDNRLIWEATTKKEDGSFSYYLYDFYTGEFWKSYLLHNWSEKNK